MSEETEEKSEGNDRKTHKITEQEYQKLKAVELRETQAYKDQTKRMRENQLQHLQLEIARINREIAFKEEELKSGITEKHPDFVEGLKPKFFIENDIDTLKQAKADYLLQISDIEKATEEEK